MMDNHDCLSNFHAKPSGIVNFNNKSLIDHTNSIEILLRSRAEESFDLKSSFRFAQLLLLVLFYHRQQRNEPNALTVGYRLKAGSTRNQVKVEETAIEVIVHLVSQQPLKESQQPAA